MKNNLQKLVILCLLLLSVCGIEAMATVYSFNYQGKKYEVVKTKKTWVQAAEYAKNHGGYLAEINNQAEQLKIFNELTTQANINNTLTSAPDGGGKAYIWLGGNDIAQEGKWIWDGDNHGDNVQFWQGKVSGSAVGGLYNNWGNEPDDYMNNQDALGFSLNGWPLGVPGQWNDLNKTNQLFFLVEYPLPVKKIEVGSLNINYGQVHINSFIEKTIEINCNGNTDLAFNGVDVLLSGSVFSANITNIPSTLEAGKKYTFKVKFSPTEMKHYTTKLIIKTDADAGNLEINLAGVGIGTKKIELIGSNKLDFGQVSIKEFIEKNIEFKVIGTLDVKFSEIKVAGAEQIFITDHSSVPSTLEAGKKYTFKVKFVPTEAKIYTTTLAIKTDADAGDHELELKGTGIGTKAIKILGASDIDFNGVDINQKLEKIIEFQCEGNIDLKFNGVEILPAGSAFTADVTQIPATLESGKKYTFKVNFLPTEAKHYTAKLVIKTDADAGNLEINLQGDGSATKKIELIGDKTLDFGKVNVKETADLNIKFKVMGASNIDFTEIKIEGEDQIFTADASTIPETLETGKTYTFKVTFAPTKNKDYAAKLAIKTDADNGDLNIDLKGSGLGTKAIKILGATEIDFGKADIGKKKEHIIEFECAGNMDMNFSGVEITPESKNFTADYGSISKTLQVGKKYKVKVTFAPYVVGKQTAKLVIKSSATTGNNKIDLTGIGEAPGSVDDMHQAGGAILSPVPTHTISSEVLCSFYLPTAGNCELNIYNSMGNDMNISISKNFEAGDNTELLNTSSLSSGAYFLVLKYKTFQLTRKFVVNK